jgi:hypothetical protein
MSILDYRNRLAAYETLRNQIVQEERAADQEETRGGQNAGVDVLLMDPLREKAWGKVKGIYNKLKSRLTGQDVPEDEDLDMDTIKSDLDNAFGKVKDGLRGVKDGAMDALEGRAKVLPEAYNDVKSKLSSFRDRLKGKQAAENPGESEQGQEMQDFASDMDDLAQPFGQAQDAAGRAASDLDNWRQEYRDQVQKMAESNQQQSAAAEDEAGPSTAGPSSDTQASLDAQAKTKSDQEAAAQQSEDEQLAKARAPAEEALASDEAALGEGAGEAAGEGAAEGAAEGAGDIGIGEALGAALGPVGLLSGLAGGVFSLVKGIQAAQAEKKEENILAHLAMPVDDPVGAGRAFGTEQI